MTYTVVIIGISLMIGLSKGGLGGPVPVSLITPILSQMMPAGQAVGLVQPLLIFADIFALRLYWGKWDKQQLRLLLPMAVIGVVLGSATLAVLSRHETVFRHILGLFTLSVVVYKVGSERLPHFTYRHQKWHGYLAGGAAGFGSALANVGAPPFTAYLLLQNISPTAFVGTTTLFFAIVNVLKLPGVLLAGVLQIPQVIGILWAVPLIPLGIWLGKRFVQVVNPKVFEWMMLVPLFIMSIYLLVSTPRS